jgi:site-specific DNA recombinase
MQSHWVHGTPYYRCRFAAEYALASHVEHPLSINLREDAVIGQVDRWLAREFAPHRLRDTISDLAAVQLAAITQSEHPPRRNAATETKTRPLDRHKSIVRCPLRQVADRPVATSGLQ